MPQPRRACDAEEAGLRLAPFRPLPLEVWSFLGALLPSLLLVVCLASGCSGRKQTPEQRQAAAQALFEQATKEFHNPSAVAQGAERERLLNQAAQNYQLIVRRYPEQSNWCAQALRSLGNIRAAQTNLDVAVKHYDAVAGKYPDQEWEVIQAWKSAADLLWEAKRREEAKKYYQKVVQRFDGTNQPAIVRLVVKGSKTRLASGE
jgi:tetratricopeptide (TPR) repeat protein